MHLTTSDDFPAENGSNLSASARRPGCICTPKPEPCDFCRIAASKSRDEEQTA